jgi:hypothetical protein
MTVGLAARPCSSVILHRVSVLAHPAVRVLRPLDPPSACKWRGRRAQGGARHATIMEDPDTRVGGHPGGPCPLPRALCRQHASQWSDDNRADRSADSSAGAGLGDVVSARPYASMAVAAFPRPCLVSRARLESAGPNVPASPPPTPARIPHALWLHPRGAEQHPRRRRC